ncbi:MAG: DTW domain-containing protein [Deltaproteobacteria bacterium]|nr:DTW domain-containing protein [Deltaproteobacteria bacterium]
MSRRNNASRRCARCRMHASLCVCPLIPRIETRTRIVLLIHRAEDRKPTNTGRLATECLPNSHVIVRGHEESPTQPFEAPPGYRPLLLFPHEDAIPLASFVAHDVDPRPVALVVPDGNWRQASRVRNRVPKLRDVPCVALPAGDPSTYRLRFEAHAAGLATLEAIARSLRLLEREQGPAIEAAMLHVFKAMVERTLWSRGDLRDHQVTGGIPAGALRHDPSSGGP